MTSKEFSRTPFPGGLMVFVEFATMVVSIWLFASGVHAEHAVQHAPGRIFGGVFLFLLVILGPFGFFVVQPNNACVLLLFGTYKGSVKKNGFWWTNPCTTRRRVSLRARNLSGEQLKVNDLVGNPIEIAAVVVWRVEDTYAARFEVDDYENFVKIQSESAVRHLASSYPYDEREAGEVSLRGSTDQVSQALQGELQEIGRASCRERVYVLV